MPAVAKGLTFFRIDYETFKEIFAFDTAHKESSEIKCTGALVHWDLILFFNNSTGSGAHDWFQPAWSLALKLKSAQVHQCTSALNFR